MHDQTGQDFLHSVRNHKIQVVKDDGICRFLAFRNPESILNWFEITTWPGSLCIVGDMGTYVFRRVRDMFTFFRSEDPDTLEINPGYWGEKLSSISTFEGYKQYSQEAFEQRVKDHLEQHLESNSFSGKHKSNLISAVHEDVLSWADNEHDAYRAVQDFRFYSFCFQDFFDGGGTTEYTPQYLWCLYAIVWGIRKYDEYKKFEATLRE
jgi:hypothetical protein